jgi:hypothetical protein
MVWMLPVYVTGGIFCLLLAVWFFCDEDSRLGARLILLAFVWPLALLWLVPWVVRAADLGGLWRGWRAEK